MTDPTLLAIDQGTTSSRAILFSKQGEILHVAQKELPQHYPHKGWVEQKPNDILNDTIECLREITEKCPEEIKACAGVGITNQRETTIIWDRETGEPVYNAIVWQDRRTANDIQALKSQGREDMVAARTGLLLDPYFSGSKIKWILDNVDGVRERAEKGDLCFGTVDSWLIWNLTGRKHHVTDATNAARTLIFNIREQKWDEELLNMFEIPSSILPDVLDNAADFGTLDKDVIGHELSICGVAGDQHAAVVGQACFEEGMIKSTYGTGCFALVNMGSEFVASQNRLLTTPAYRLNGEVTFALEGAIFIAGAAIQWLRDNLKIVDQAADTEHLARSVDENNGVYFVPAFTGLGAPHWRPDIHAAIFGLTRESSFAHIARAALEAQAYQSYDLFTAMASDIGREVETIRADGGLVANSFMCQFLSDILNTPVEIPKVAETTALGAAYLAGLQSGVYRDLEEISKLWEIDREYKPAMSLATRDHLLSGWREAIERLL